MKNAMLKNAFAEIAKTKSRFFSIFGIIAIGTGFFSGLLASEPDMRLSSDSYFDRTNLMNYRIVSTYGFDEKDIEAIQNTEGVNVYPGYFTDAFVHTDSGDKVARLYSLDKPGENNPYSEIQLLDGRLPQKPDECIVDGGKLVKGYSLGDKITLKGDKDNAIEDTLSVTEYTVVGRFNTPMFISDTERGNTTIGNGSVFMLAYVPAENFKTEYYTEVFVTADMLKDYNCYSDEYKAASDEIKERLEQAADKRETERFDSIRDEAEQKITDAQKELDDKRKEAFDEIDKNEKELEDAKKKLDDAKAELESGKKELDDKKKELDDAKTEIEENEKLLSDTKKTLDENKKKLEDGKAELDNAEKQLNETKLQLDSAEKQLNDKRPELESAEKQLSDTEKMLAQSKAQLDSTAEELDFQQSELDKQRLQLEQGIAAGMVDEQTAAVMKAQLDAAQLQLDEGRRQYEQGLAQYNEGKAQYDAAFEEYSAGKAQYDGALAEYSNGRKLYEDGLAKYNESVKQYESGMKQLNDGYAEYKKGLARFSEGKAEYEDGKKQIADAYIKYEDGVKELADGYAEYEDGAKKLADAKTEAEEKLADGQKEIDEAKDEINKLKAPEWYVFDREDNPGYAEYGQNAERIKNIALVFPVFFVLVAALVCLTTMTRMVEEQRVQIGTLKALGYSNGSIIFKYLLYAVVAASFGALAGTLIGMKIFPAIIISAYAMMYKIPDMLLPYDTAMIAMTVGAAALMVILTVYFACKAELGEQPAGLMRPKAPKSGKKIMLERMSFLWKRLSFSQKVTMRNIFRYKRRMFMTVIGIAGCTALVLTGFGVYDSVNDILHKQFDEISNYTGIVAHEEDMSAESYDKAAAVLDEYGCNSGRVYQKQISVSANGESNNAYIFAAESNEEIAKFVTVKNRNSGELYTVTDDGVIINEKLAALLGGVNKGDKVTLSLTDTKQVSVTVTEICENYSYHYIYITENLYKQLSGENIAYNCIFFNSSDMQKLPDNIENEIAEKLMDVDGIMAVSFKTGVESTFSNMLKSLNLVVVVLIVSAGLLAFIVLYNLTNININERIKEIATLKVLGFYDKEVSMYVFREIFMLTALGTVAGLLFGRLLTDFVVKTAEIDMVMFGREVHPLSFGLSVIITLVFALLVTLVMHRHLKKVDMVEALKSVE